MKAVFALLVIALVVLAAPDWAGIEKKFQEICDHAKDSVDKVKEAIKADADKDATKCIGEIMDKCLDKVNAFYKDTVKPCVEKKTLTAEKADEYCKQTQKIKEEHEVEMKPKMDKLAPENKKKVQEICDEDDKFRQEKITKIMECLKS